MNTGTLSLNNVFRGSDVVKNTSVENANIKSKKVRSIGGSIGALALAGVVKNVASAPFQKLAWDKKINYGTFNSEEGKVLHDAINEMYVQAGLKEKGVRIRYLNNKSKIKDGTIIHHTKFGKFSDTVIKDFYDKHQIRPVREGYNAFFIAKDVKVPKITYSKYLNIVRTEGEEKANKMLKENAVYIKKNTVLLSKQGDYSAGFHELGHAMDHNFSKLGKFLLKSRPVWAYAPILITLYGACTKKAKPKNENDKLNNIQNTHNFIRNNAGKLAFLAYVPLLLEEIMATVKGRKFAKKLLKPEMAEKVLKNYYCGFATYLILAIFGALGATVAVKTKDNAIANKEARVIGRSRDINCVK